MYPDIHQQRYVQYQPHQKGQALHEGVLKPQAPGHCAQSGRHLFCICHTAYTYCRYCQLFRY